MVYMGAIANGGKTAVPQIIHKTVSALGIPSLPAVTAKTDTLVAKDTAERITELMAENVEKTYGTKRFPTMDLCAMSGTADFYAMKRLRTHL